MKKTKKSDKAPADKLKMGKTIETLQNIDALLNALGGIPKPEIAEILITVEPMKSQTFSHFVSGCYSGLQKYLDWADFHAPYRKHKVLGLLGTMLHWANRAEEILYDLYPETSRYPNIERCTRENTYVQKGIDWAEFHTSIQNAVRYLQECQACVQDKPTAEAPTPPDLKCKQYGQIYILGDYVTAIFEKKFYPLTNTKNVRSIIKYLCEHAVGKNNKVQKQTILNCGMDTVNSDWRPSQDFRGKLKPLFGCVGEERGSYWLKN